MKLDKFENDHFNNVFLVVLGSPNAAMLPAKRIQATKRIGMLGFTLINKPKILVPMMAPSLAMRRWIPAAVARRYVG